MENKTLIVYGPAKEINFCCGFFYYKDGKILQNKYRHSITEV